MGALAPFHRPSGGSLQSGTPPGRKWLSFPQAKGPPTHALATYHPGTS